LFMIGDVHVWKVNSKRLLLSESVRPSLILTFLLAL